jgi:hypothetical protein
MHIPNLPEPAVYILVVALIVWYAPSWGHRIIKLLRDWDDYRAGR